MALDAKISFQRQLEAAMKKTLTVEQMGLLLSATAEVLDRFEMRESAWTDGEKDDLLESYIDALQVQCKSQKTIDRYGFVIRHMMEYVKVPTRKISKYHLRNYLAHEKERGLRDSSLESTRQVLSAYFNWLQRESLIEQNPVANLGVIKVAKKEKEIYTETEIAKLLDCCGSDRDRAIIHFLRSTGCRISEMTELDRDAVNFSALECVVHGKGNKERTIYLDEVAGMALEQYLRTRTDGDSAMFVNRYGKRIQTNGVRQRLKELAETAGVEHVHPHKFRRTLATNMCRHGMPVQTVARILGHEKLDTTMRYVTMNKEGVKAEYRRYT